MDMEMRVKLKSLLIKHEKEKLLPYIDTVGKLTIGIGRNLTDCGIRPDESELMFNNDVDFFYNFLSHYPWFHELNEARKCALIDMAFMGAKKFTTFEQMIKALSVHDYDRAAIEVLDSLYARKEAPHRAEDIARILRTGEL